MPNPKRLSPEQLEDAFDAHPNGVHKGNCHDFGVKLRALRDHIKVQDQDIVDLKAEVSSLEARLDPVQAMKEGV